MEADDGSRADRVAWEECSMDSPERGLDGGLTPVTRCIPSETPQIDRTGSDVPQNAK